MTDLDDKELLERYHALKEDGVMMTKNSIGNCYFNFSLKEIIRLSKLMETDE